MMWQVYVTDPATGRRMWLDRTVAEQWRANARAFVLARRGFGALVVKEVAA